MDKACSLLREKLDSRHQGIVRLGQNEQRSKSLDTRAVLAQLPQALLPWYEAGHRALPWREDREPYHIWLSEIMLQQTRVEAVKGYYLRFLKELPTLLALAQCPDDRLNKLWEGLGYYSRARNLKKAAQVIMETHGGRFPSDFDAVLALPGVGAYTAGAVCSIAFNQPRAAVDGNVLRLVARLTDDSTPIDGPRRARAVTQALEEIYPPQAGDFTQALMELGATLCGPNRPPQCPDCPCRAFCRGRLHGTCQALPVKAPKGAKRQEEKTVFVLRCDGCWALRKRPATGLLAGLWEFPNVTGKLSPQQALTWLEEQGIAPRALLRQVERGHVFTHIRWHMRGFYVEVKDKAPGLTWLTPEEIASLAALPTAFRQFWQEP